MVASRSIIVGSGLVALAATLGCGASRAQSIDALYEQEMQTNLAALSEQRRKSRLGDVQLIVTVGQTEELEMSG